MSLDVTDDTLCGRARIYNSNFSIPFGFLLYRLLSFLSRAKSNDLSLPQQWLQMMVSNLRLTSFSASASLSSPVELPVECEFISLCIISFLLVLVARNFALLYCCCFTRSRSSLFCFLFILLAILALRFPLFFS